MISVFRGNGCRVQSKLGVIQRIVSDTVVEVKFAHGTELVSVNLLEPIVDSTGWGSLVKETRASRKLLRDRPSPVQFPEPEDDDDEVLAEENAGDAVPELDVREYSREDEFEADVTDDGGDDEAEEDKEADAELAEEAE